MILSILFPFLSYLLVVAIRFCAGAQNIFCIFIIRKALKIFKRSPLQWITKLYLASADITRCDDEKTQRATIALSSLISNTSNN